MTTGNATASSSRSAWGRYLLLFCVAAWMFVLGVLVGRGTAPVHFDTEALQKELANLRDAMLNKERETLERTIRGEDEAEKVPLEFYEELRKDGPDTGDQIAERLPPSTGELAADGAVATETPPHKTRAALMAKRSGLQVRTSAVAAAAPTAPASAEDDNAAKGRLTIQIAALKDGEAAQRIVANLKKEGYPAYLFRQAVAGEGLWFKVRVGHYRDHKQAAADMARLRDANRRPILIEN